MCVLIVGCISPLIRIDIINCIDLTWFVKVFAWVCCFPVGLAYLSWFA